MAINTRGSSSLWWGTGIDTKGVEQGAKKTKGILRGLASQISAMDIFAAVSAGAAYHFKKVFKEAAMLAARYETLGVVLNTVGENAGYATEEINGFVKGLEDAGITMTNSRLGIIRMAQAQLDLTKATQLARVAQDAAVIANINSSEAFERILQGIQTGRIMVLRSIGINVLFEESYQKAAKAVGKLADDLTSAEKTQIRMNVVLEAGKQIAGSYTAAMETASKQRLSLERYVEDTKVMLGQFLLPLYSETIKTIINFTHKLSNALGLISDEYYAIEKNYDSIIKLNQKRKRNIDEYLKTIDTLNKKTKLTQEESENLLRAEKNLATYIGKDTVAAFGDAASSLDLYNAAKEKSLQIDRDILALQLRLAKINEKQIKHQMALFDLEKDKSNLARQTLEKDKRQLEAGLRRRTGLSIGLANVPEEMQEHRIESIKKNLRKIGIEVTDEISTTIKALFNKDLALFPELMEAYIDKILADNKDILIINEKIKLSLIGQQLAREKMNLDLETTKERIDDINKAIETGGKLPVKAAAPERKEPRTGRQIKEGLEGDKGYDFFPFLGGSKAAFAEYELQGRDFDKKLQKRLDRLKKTTTASNKETLAQILKDTRQFNAKDWAEYVKHLGKKAELYEDDKVLRDKILDEQADAIKAGYRAEIKQIQERGEAFSALGDIVAKFNSEIGISIRLSGDLATSAGKIKMWDENTTDLQKMNDGLQATLSIVDLIIQAYGRWEEVAQRTKDRMESLENMLSKVFRDIVSENLKAIEETLGTEKLDLMEKFIKDAKDFLLAPGDVTVEAIRIVEDELKDLNRMLDEALTGTTADSIADSITTGLMDGLDSAKLFADNFETLIEKALTDAFSRKILTGLMEPWYAEFAKLAEGGLDAEEIDILRTQFDVVAESAEKQFKSMKEFMLSVGISPAGADKTGLSANALQGVSEQTAGLLTGQMNSMLGHVINSEETLNLIKNATESTRTRLAYGSDIHLRLSELTVRASETKQIHIDVRDYTSVIMETALSNLTANQETAINTRHLVNIERLLGGAKPGTGVGSVGELAYLDRVTRAIGV